MNKQGVVGGWRDEMPSDMMSGTMDQIRRDANSQRYHHLQTLLKRSKKPETIAQIEALLAKEFPQGVAEGSKERSQNRLWQMITDYEQRAKATKNDIKKAHFMKMASELRGKLKTSDEQGVAEGSEQELVNRQVAYWDQVAKEKKNKERDALKAKKAEHEKTPIGKAEKYWSEKGVAEGNNND